MRGHRGAGWYAQRRPLLGDKQHISLYTILFHFKAVLWSLSSFDCHPPTCNAYRIAILLHAHCHCAIYAPPPTLPLYAIHHTILLMAVSRKGQAAHQARLATVGLESMMIMICLPPQGTPPPHSSRYGPQHTQHTASTAATPHYPQGRRQTPADAPTPLKRSMLTSFGGPRPRFGAMKARERWFTRSNGSD